MRTTHRPPTLALHPGQRQRGEVIRLSEVAAVVLFSDAPAELARWYEEVIEAQRLVDDTDFIALGCGAVTLLVQKSSEGHRPGMGGVRPHFRVADCREALAALCDAGAEVVLPLRDTGGEWVAAVRDPHGNPVGLLQRKRR